MWHPTQYHTSYHVVFVSHSYFAGGRWQPVLSPVLGHIQQWSSPLPEINEYEMLLFYGSYSNDTWYIGDSGRLLVVDCTLSCLSVANCDRFLNILQYLHFPNIGGSFDSIGKLWKTVESMTHFNNEWCVLIPNIWLVAKYWYFSKEA